MASASDNIISGYKILERIGSGAESSIYRAREMASGKILALKHVLAESQENYKYCRHVCNEYENLRLIQGDNGFQAPKGIVRAHRLIRKGRLRRRKECILVMDYVPGHTLAAESRYPIGQMVDIMLQVARALQRLHAKGLVHGDLKPENVIVSLEGVATLIDFGFSCPAGSQAKSIRGTRDYMAPEQVEKGIIGEHTDIYNFGAMTYYLLTRRHLPSLIPAQGGDAHFIAHRDHTAKPIRQIKPGVPPKVANLVTRCCRLEPAARPACIEEVITELEEAAAAFNETDKV